VDEKTNNVKAQLKRIVLTRDSVQLAPGYFTDESRQSPELEQLSTLAIRVLTKTTTTLQQKRENDANQKKNVAWNPADHAEACSSVHWRT